MSTYQSNPVTIEAAEIVSVGSDAGGDGVSFPLGISDGSTVVELYVNPAQFGNHEPAVGDYWIMGDGGDNYLCPKAVFEKKYSLVDSSKAA